jgi:hypothetical protein
VRHATTAGNNCKNPHFCWAAALTRLGGRSKLAAQFSPTILHLA